MLWQQGGIGDGNDKADRCGRSIKFILLVPDAYLFCWQGLYAAILSKLRLLMITRMAKPEEVRL